MVTTLIKIRIAGYCACSVEVLFDILIFLAVDVPENQICRIKSEFPSLQLLTIFKTSPCANFRYFTPLHELFAQIFGGLFSRRNVQLPESYRLLSDSRLKQHGLKYFTSTFSVNVPWNLSLVSCNVSFRGIFCFLELLVSYNVSFPRIIRFLESFVSWNSWFLATFVS